jgi:hypothetical protein
MVLRATGWELQVNEALQKIPLAVGELRELFPADEQKLRALVLQQVRVGLHVPEEKIRAVVKRDDVLGCVVAAIERSRNLFLEEVLDAARRCSQGLPGVLPNGKQQVLIE